MGMNEQRMLTGFFADLIKMHDINDVTAAMSAAVASSAAKAPLSDAEIHHDEPAVESSPRDEMEKQKQRMLKHFSFCNGLFPIHTVRTPSGCMGKCVINGRKFSFSSVDESGPDDHACTVRIWDGGNQVAFMSILRGRAIAEPMAMGALKAYVKQLSGAGKFHSRGGFLKQALKRWQEAQKKESVNG